MPEAKLARAFYRLDTPKTDHPGEWAKYRAMQQMDETQTIKPDGLISAIKQRQLIVEQELLSGQMRKAGINKGRWQAIGPDNVGGRVRSILIHPTQPQRMWAGSVSGGIWYSTNGGKLWKPVDDFMGNLAITSLQMASKNPKIMYAATGEGFFNTDAVRGAGVFKSVDGGRSWKQLPATNPAKDAAWEYVNRIAIHPTRNNILLAATQGGLFKSIDSGKSWRKIVKEYNFFDVKFSPDAQGAVASGRIYDKSLKKFTHQIFIGNSSGSQWRKGGKKHQGRIELAYAPSQSGYIYASIYNRKRLETSDGDVIELNGELYRSMDYGMTWSLVSSPNHLGNQGWYDNAIWVDPTNHQHLIVGGIDLFRSTDGGLSWRQISRWWDSSSIHADQHIIISHPHYGGGNKTVFFGNDGGIYKISNIEDYNNITELNNGLAITQFYDGAGHNGKNGRIIGGTQDNGSLVYTGERKNWSAFAGGDGGYTAINADNGDYIYGEYQNMEIHRTVGNGRAHRICRGITEVTHKKDSNGKTVCGTKNSRLAANFIAPLIIDPNDNRYLYAGGASLWRTEGALAKTPKWVKIKQPIKDNRWGYISQIAAVSGEKGTVWVGHNNGELYVTHNALAKNPAWQRVGQQALPRRMVLSILVDHHNPELIYVGFGGYSKDNLYMTMDGGLSWQDISGNLPDSPIRTIQKHPVNSNWLYVGTEVGIFTSENGGQSWTSDNDGPANVSVDKLFWLDDATLVAATHGRGMFKATVAGGESRLAAPVMINPDHITSDTTPTFYWKAMDDADTYKILVKKGRKTVIHHRIAKRDANCNRYNCWITSKKKLAAGDYVWKIRSHQGTKVSSWNTMSFRLDPSLKPATANLLTPKGQINTQTPTYRWNKADQATLYYLSAQRIGTLSKNYVYGRWLSAKSLGCNVSKICVIKPTLHLGVGDYHWRVLTWNYTGYGEWSKFKTFSIQ